MLANWPELETDRPGVGKVKQEKPILVILGDYARYWRQALDLNE
jgi:hypothetical protein